MKNYKLSIKQWLFVVFAGLLVIVLREFASPLFMVVWNILIVLYALLISAFVYAERYYFIYAVLLVSFGVAVHVFEFNQAIEDGLCQKFLYEGIFAYIKQMDSCLNYTESWVLYAQAALLSGLVIVVIYFVSEAYKIYHFFKNEY